MNPLSDTRFGSFEREEVSLIEIGRQSRSRQLKSEVEALLRAEHWVLDCTKWRQFPARRVINPLIAFLCSTEELVKWRAVMAIGCVVARLADSDLESARTIMRRFIWSLNDESGGIAWGAPEAMGEIMACHSGLAGEYVHILISYIRPDGNPLQYELLERGVLWGLGRLAEVRPGLMGDAAACGMAYLESADPVLRGLAARLMGLLKSDAAVPLLNALTADRAPVTIFCAGKLQELQVGHIALRALRDIRP